jgi:hypothetical protein
MGVKNNNNNRGPVESSAGELSSGGEGAEGRELAALAHITEIEHHSGYTATQTQ